jgi:hypothetical protein
MLKKIKSKIYEHVAGRDSLAGEFYLQKLIVEHN